MLARTCERLPELTASPSVRCRQAAAIGLGAQSLSVASTHLSRRERLWHSSGDSLGTFGPAATSNHPEDCERTKRKNPYSGMTHLEV